MAVSQKILENKIRDLYKVKLYTIRSETKKEREREREREKRERERERERKKMRERAKLQIFINPNTDRGVISDLN